MNASWHSKLQRLDAAIRPIATRPIAIEDLETVLNDPNPLDAAAVRDDSEALMLELLESYSQGNDADRRDMRSLVPQYKYFFWAATAPMSGTLEDKLRLRLLRFALLDQYPDPRDATLSLDSLCDTPGLPRSLLHSTLKAVAALASDDDRYGFGSTRSMLLGRISRRFGTTGPS